jgi:hypothetical protein
LKIRRGATVEININKRTQASLCDATAENLSPWAEAQGYRHGLAPRGPGSFQTIEMHTKPSGAQKLLARRGDFLQPLPAQA